MPAGELPKLGVEPEKTERFSLADCSLLGALSLESLGLLLEPFKRELRPMRLVLYAAASA